MTITVKRPKALGKKDQPGETIRYAIGTSSLGTVLVASSDLGIIAILLGEEEPGDLLQEFRYRFPRGHLVQGDKSYNRVLKTVITFLDTPGAKLNLPLDLRGTDFQCRVWQAVMSVPAGEIKTYSDIARKIGAPRAMRAVGTACAGNNISMAIPCHRILRSDGTPSGSRNFSAARQLFLIDREQ